MPYFNYHAKLKRLLESKPYRAIKAKPPFVIRFVFSDGKSMPIRAHRLPEYADYIGSVADKA